MKCAAEVNWNLFIRERTSSIDEVQIPKKAFFLVQAQQWMPIAHVDKYWAPFNTSIIVKQERERIQFQDCPDSFKHMCAIRLLDISLLLLQLF